MQGANVKRFIVVKSVQSVNHKSKQPRGSSKINRIKNKDKWKVSPAWKVGGGLDNRTKQSLHVLELELAFEPRLGFVRTVCQPNCLLPKFNSSMKL